MFLVFNGNSSRICNFLQCRYSNCLTYKRGKTKQAVNSSISLSENIWLCFLLFKILKEKKSAVMLKGGSREQQQKDKNQNQNHIRYI